MRHWNKNHLLFYYNSARVVYIGVGQVTHRVDNTSFLQLNGKNPHFLFFGVRKVKAYVRQEATHLSSLTELLTTPWSLRLSPECTEDWEHSGIFTTRPEPYSHGVLCSFCSAENAPDPDVLFPAAPSVASQRPQMLLKFNVHGMHKDEHKLLKGTTW